MAFAGGHFHGDRLFPDRRGRFQVRARRLIDIGIVRAPDQIAGADSRGFDHSVAETQFEAATPLDYLKYASALFRLLGTPPVRGIEDHAVPRFQRCDPVRGSCFDGDALSRDLGDLAHLYAAMSGRAPAHHSLVIGSAEEEGSKSARIDLLELLLVEGVDGERAAGPSLIHGFAIGVSSERDVFRILVPALDLQRGKA